MGQIFAKCCTASDSCSSSSSGFSDRRCCPSTIDGISGSATTTPVRIIISLYTSAASQTSKDPTTQSGMGSGIPFSVSSSTHDR